MTANDRFDRDLAAWLDADTSLSAPAGLHAGAMDQARRASQRPAWLVAVRGGTIAAGRQSLLDGRTVYALVVVGLLVAGLAVIALGALRTRPQPLGSNGLIAYSYQGRNHGPGGTRLVGPDGSGDRLSPLAGCVRFSHDGRFIVGGSDDGPLTNVRIVDIGPGDVRLVPTPSLDWSWHPHAGSFALSPDGTHVAWLKDLDPASEGPHRLELWVSRVQDGSGTSVISPQAGDPERFGIPAWSPDGRELAFESFTTDAPTGRVYRSTISVVDAETRAVRVISSRPGLVEPGLAWSLDGGSIVYAGAPDGLAIPPERDGDPPEVGSPSDLFVIGADGSGERYLTSTTASEHQPVLAPDGARLGFLTSAGNDGTTSLTTLPMDGTNPAGTPTLGPPAEFVIWSPDAKQLLTTSSGIESIDRDLKDPLPIAAVDGTIICPPSWQRVDP